MSRRESPWTWMAIGMALVFAMALGIGVIIAKWTGTPDETALVEDRPLPGGQRVTTERPAHPRTGRGLPPQAVVEVCNSQAAARVGPRAEPLDVQRPGSEVGGGASAGTLYGLSDRRRDDGPYRDAYSGCMRSRGYVG